MTSVSRRWLHFGKLGILLLVLFFASSVFTLRSAAAEEDENTAHRTTQSDGRQQVISIQVDGKRTPCLVSGSTTVGEQLNKLGISLEQMDTVSPPKDTVLSQGDDIIVKRKRLETVEEKGVIAHDTVYTYSPDVTAGTERVLVEGADGYGTRTYEVLMEDGVEVERTLLRESLDKKPVTKEIGTGFRTPLISPYNFDWSFNEKGEPLSYDKVLRGQRSSAYSARNGAKTASGRDAVVGHVAVNPNVIPYGSKLFIQSKDGNYIYGYAIAADTGTALMDGRVAVDIFYDTYQECVQHGIVDVDIFVLESA